MGERRRSSGAGVAAGATALGAVGGAAATGIPAGLRERKVWKDTLVETNKHPIFKAIYEGNKKKVHETARKTILQKAKGKARAGALVGTVLGASFGAGHMAGKWKKAAAYKLQGRLKFQGLSISIENAKGSTRTWKDPHGKEVGSTKMHFAYGYIRKTEGTDGDHVDVYIGPNADAKMAYVIDQNKKPPGDIKKDGKAWTQFDEQKVMLGFPSAKAAKDAYNRQYDDPRFFRSLRAMPMEDFKTKVLTKSNFGKKVAMFLDNPNDPFHTPPTARHHIPPTQRKRKKAGLRVQVDHANKIAGVLTHDPTKHLSDGDRALIKKHHKWFMRTGPGLGLQAAAGAVGGTALTNILTKNKASVKARVLGAAAGSAVLTGLTHAVRSSKSGRRADVATARHLLATAKAKEKKAALTKEDRRAREQRGRDVTYGSVGAAIGGAAPWALAAARPGLGIPSSQGMAIGMAIGAATGVGLGRMHQDHFAKQRAKARLMKKAQLAYQQEFFDPIAIAEHQGIKLAQEYWDGMTEMEKEAAITQLIAKGVGGLLRGGAAAGRGAAALGRGAARGAGTVARAAKGVASGAKKVVSRGATGGVGLVKKTRAGAGKLVAKGQAAGRRGAANVEASYLQGRRGLSPRAAKAVQAERAGVRASDKAVARAKPGSRAMRKKNPMVNPKANAQIEAASFRLGPEKNPMVNPMANAQIQASSARLGPAVKAGPSPLVAKTPNAPAGAQGPYRQAAPSAPVPPPAVAPAAAGTRPVLAVTPEVRAVRNQRAQLRLDRIKGKGLVPGSRGTGAPAPAPAPAAAAAGGGKIITGKRILGATALVGAGGLAYGGMKAVDTAAGLVTRGGNPNYIAPRVPGIGRPY